MDPESAGAGRDGILLDPTGALGRAAVPGLAELPWPYFERRSRPRTQPEPVGGADPVQIAPQRSPLDTTGDEAEPVAVEPQGAKASWTRLLALTLVVLDAVVGLCAAASASTLRFDGVDAGGAYVWGLLVVPPTWVLAVGLCHGYESRWFGAGAEEFRCVLRAGMVVAGGAAIVSYALHAQLARGYVLPVCAAAVFGSLAARLACRAVLQGLRRRGRALVDVLLVGHEMSVAHLVRQVDGGSEGGLRIVGACVPTGRSLLLESMQVPVLGDLHQVTAVVRRSAVHTVAVTASAEMNGPALRRLAWGLEGTGIDLVVAPGLVDVAGPRLHIRPLCGLPLLHVEEPELVGARRLVKAALDRVGALTALIAFSPILCLIAVAVAVTTSGPVLFSQSRVGKDGRPFRMWKFRTMYSDAEQRWLEVRDDNLHGQEVLFKMRADPRVTPLGRRLRRYSLDELPQLFNVLLGHMSLVGPRPPLPREVARYGVGAHRRLLVKPGLTGLWQIRGRSDLSWDESIRLDLRYVENWTLSLDVLIMWRTLAAVVRGRGAY